MEVQKFLDAAVRHMEAAERFTGEDRRALESIALGYWRLALEAASCGAVTHYTE